MTAANTRLAAAIFVAVVVLGSVGSADWPAAVQLARPALRAGQAVLSGPAASDPTVQEAAPARQDAARQAPLTGQISRATLEAFPGWETLRAQDYTPDPAAVAIIRDRTSDVQALLFVATWCPDSRREVPRFLKILDQAGFEQSRLTFHGLDRTKKDAGGLTDRWTIERVPTFILLRRGQEIGRIVERPKSTLESDLVQILK